MRSDSNLSKLAAVKAMDIGAYLSTPVVIHDGSVYGTLCCIGHQPRSALGRRELDSLRYVAGIVAAELERASRRMKPATELLAFSEVTAP